MKHDNPIPFTTRLKELFIDWLIISAYLLCLFGVSMACYFLVLGGIPAFSELHSQLIATFSSVLGVIHSMYSNFDTLRIILTIISCALLIIMFLMGALRRDRRHLGDMVAGTQVQRKESIA